MPRNPEITSDLMISDSDLVAIYFSETGDYETLTQDEEIALAQRIERGYQARSKLSQETLRKSLLSELELEIRDGHEAELELSLRYTKLVVSIAKKYQGKGLPFIELIQEGNLGLLRAVKYFDYHRGFRFSTYATWHIRDQIKRSLTDQSGVHIPKDIMEKISTAVRRLTAELGYTPNPSQIASELGCQLVTVERFLGINYQLSLDNLENREVSPLDVFVEPDQFDSTESSALSNISRQQLEKAMEKLLPRDAMVLKLLYGWYDGKIYTNKEIGDKMGVSHQFIFIVKKRALERLHSLSSINKLR